MTAPTAPQLVVPVLAGWQQVDVDPATAVVSARRLIAARVAEHPELAPSAEALLLRLLQSAAVAAALGTSGLWVQGSGAGTPDDPLSLATLALGFLPAPQDPGPLLDSVLGRDDDDRPPPPVPWHRIEVPLGIASRRTVLDPPQAGQPERLSVQWALSLSEWGMVLVLVATTYDSARAAELTRLGELVLSSTVLRPADWRPGQAT